MGCDISILSRHNLNITNVETLAIDLSNRLGFSIEYGYYNIEIFSTLLENDLKEDFISLGYIEKKPFTDKQKHADGAADGDGNSKEPLPDRFPRTNAKATQRQSRHNGNHGGEKTANAKKHRTTNQRPSEI